MACQTSFINLHLTFAESSAVKDIVMFNTSTLYTLSSSAPHQANMQKEAGLFSLY